jgi:diguanylate cyclase (GGDEF)-like protein
MSVSEYFSFDLIQDPFLMLFTDGTVYDINASCASLIGRTKEEIRGRSYKDFDLLDMFGEKITESFKSSSEDFDLLVHRNRHYEVSILPFRAKADLKLIRIILKDISGYVTLERELLKRNKELMIINSLSSAFIHSENIDLVIENLLRKVLLITDFRSGWLFLKDDNVFMMKTCHGVSDEFKTALEEGSLTYLCEEAAESSNPLLIMEAPDIAKSDVLTKEGVVFIAAVPLISDQKIIGLLFLASKNDKKSYLDFDFTTALPLVGNHISLIVDKIRLFQETKRLSITDDLTGLYNSRYFYRQLEAEIARANRYGDPFSLILFDIDDFKRLNDTYGHQAGDDVLCELAKILISVSRESDVVVRYGGEEFFIILPNTLMMDTFTFAERIRDRVEKAIFLPNHAGEIKITLSGGVASFPQSSPNVKSLLNAADNALYCAKASGKNKILCFEEK